jgi:hypothetical protein
MSDSEKPAYVLWPYTPSLVGGVIAGIVFAVLFGLHTWRLIRNRTWFCIPFVIGAIVSVISSLP